MAAPGSSQFGSARSSSSSDSFVSVDDGVANFLPETGAVLAAAGAPFGPGARPQCAGSVAAQS